MSDQTGNAGSQSPREPALLSPSEQGDKSSLPVHGEGWGGGFPMLPV